MDFGLTRHHHKNIENQNIISHTFQCSYFSENDTTPIKSKDIIPTDMMCLRIKLSLLFHICFHADLCCKLGEVTFYLHRVYVLWSVFWTTRK